MNEELTYLPILNSGTEPAEPNLLEFSLQLVQKWGQVYMEVSHKPLILRSNREYNHTDLENNLKYQLFTHPKVSTMIYN